MNKPKKPLLRWHGGKWMLAPWIISHFPEHRIYVELFGGAASVLMRKERSYAEVYNEIDTDAVNLFQILRSNKADALVRSLKLTPFARSEFISAYEPTEDPIEKARRLVIRSFMGFGSNGHNINTKTGFRCNSNRSGTTPARDWYNYPKRIPALIERLRGVVIENRNALDIIPTHDTEKTLFYVDPPYLPETRTGGKIKRMYANEMTTEDHEKLLIALLQVKGMVVLSGYPSDLYDAMLYGWKRIQRNAFADGARRRTEVLWLNERATRG